MSTITLDGIVNDPSAPTNLTAKVLFDTILLTWDNPAIVDLDVIQVYRNTTNDSGTATKIASIKGESYADDINSYGETRYYWVKAKNMSGGVSGFSNVATGTTSGFVRIKYGEYTEGIPAPLVEDAVHFEISDNKMYRANPLNRNNVIGVKDANGDIVGPDARPRPRVADQGAGSRFDHR